tara:strand:- start:107906 stop:108520 length:615 start_codon:yes stop_codon:yes gene_type:complete
MTKLALNKSALSAEKKKHHSYGKYLPSLELKQKQLLSERKKHQAMLLEHQQKILLIEQSVHKRLPMLAVENIELSKLVEIVELQIEQENLLGTLLPVLKHVEYKHAHYSYLSRPHWVDDVANALESVVKLKLEEAILEKRLQKLTSALQIITQRVNLFSKVLLPQTKNNIKRIGLFLADQDRAAVVRSKLAKRKHQLESAEAGE